MTASAGLAVDVRGVDKRFGGRVALRRVDLRIEPGEFLTLFGPNGAGKTTLTKIIAIRILIPPKYLPLHAARLRGQHSGSHG